jgi:hypothetical protein
VFRTILHIILAFLNLRVDHKAFLSPQAGLRVFLSRRVVRKA